jgi:hypothetical protein
MRKKNEQLPRSPKRFSAVMLTNTKEETFLTDFQTQQKRYKLFS